MYIGKAIHAIISYKIRNYRQNISTLKTKFNENYAIIPTHINHYVPTRTLLRKLMPFNTNQLHFDRNRYGNVLEMISVLLPTTSAIGLVI